MMDAFDQRVAAVADIPFTRLMGRSPAGMNATGSHDMDNHNKAIVTGQKLELRPCMEALDPFLLASAGVSDAAPAVSDTAAAIANRLAARVEFSFMAISWNGLINNGNAGEAVIQAHRTIPVCVAAPFCPLTRGLHVRKLAETKAGIASDRLAAPAPYEVAIPVSCS